jgi:hypothetical protein
MAPVELSTGAVFLSGLDWNGLVCSMILFSTIKQLPEVLDFDDILETHIGNA